MRFKLIARKQSCCKTGKYPALRGPPQTSGEKHAARTIRREWTPRNCWTHCTDLIFCLHNSFNQSINQLICLAVLILLPLKLQLLALAQRCVNVNLTANAVHVLKISPSVSVQLQSVHVKVTVPVNTVQ